MHAKHIITFVVCHLVALTAVVADHHQSASDAEAVLEATQAYNGAANSGDWEERYSFYALGRTAFYEAGMIRTDKNTQQNLDNQIKYRIERDKNGRERRVFLRHPEVVMHGDVAVVTCYQHGWFRSTADSESEDVLNRVTIVWKRTDDGWKIVHEHYSEMKKDF